jgi:uncharacterized protein
MSKIIAKTRDYVQEKLQGESSGHDWWHIHRVHRLARLIAEQESADLEVVELAALLHDIADWKFHDGDLEIGPKIASQWLTSLGVSEPTIKHVANIIRHSSFKGAKVPDNMTTLEGKIVQDADRLDAIGAIGIARTFAYGGNKNRSMYEPDVAAELHESFAAYQKNQSTTLNHFHEKLLLLKDRMHTDTAKKVAQQRHQIMVNFLQQFHDEWDANHL